MDRHRNVVAESMVVQDIYTEEQHDVDQPAANGHLIRLQEEGWPAGVKL